MKTIQFNPNGGPLTARICLGNIVANYEIFLREKNSNAQSSLLTGDNLNPEDNSIPQPTPVIINDGRRVILENRFCWEQSSSGSQLRNTIRNFSGRPIFIGY